MLGVRNVSGTWLNLVSRSHSELSVPVRRAGSFVSAIILQSDHHNLLKSEFNVYFVLPG